MTNLPSVSSNARPPYPEALPPVEMMPANWLTDWLGAVRRHIVLAMVLGIALFGLVFGGSYLLTPLYRATAAIMLQARNTEVVKIDPVLSRLPNDSDTVSSELQVLRSRDLIGRLVADLKLDEHPEFDPNRPARWREYIAGMVTWLPEPLHPLAIALGQPTPLEGSARLDAVIDSVARHIDAVPVGRSRVINITFTSREPDLPSVVVNRLAEIYVANQYEIKQRVSQEANKWITADLVRLSQNTAAAAQRVADFRAEHGLIDGKDSTLIRQQISEVDSQLTAARGQRLALEARLENLNARGDPSSSSVVLASPIIQSLRQQRAILTNQNTELDYTYGDKNPRLLSNNAQVKALDAGIASETQKIVTSIQRDYRVAVENEKSLQLHLADLKALMGRLQTAEVTLRQLEDEERSERTVYANFLQRSKETGKAEFEVPEAILISHAAAPLRPYFPDRTLAGVAGLIISFAGALIFVFFYDRSDATFRSQEQMERALKTPVIGIIPEFSRRKMPTLDPLTLMGSVMTDLYTRILLRGDIKCVLIASALPREGKTITGLFLARTIAMNGHSVLLVDGDLRRSGLRHLCRTSGAGLSDVLTGKASFADVLRHDENTGVDFIDCGSAAGNPTGLLASPRMLAIVEEARKRYDFTIIDSPAVMAGPDAAVLSSYADRTLIFARWAKTPREVVAVAMRRLNEAGAKVGGAILTRIDLKRIKLYSLTDAMGYSKAMRRYYPMSR